MTPHLHVMLLALLLVCSGVVSGSETALFALSPHSLRSFQRSDSRFKRLAAELMQHPRKLLITVLITNTTVNVCFFAVSLFYLERLSHQRPWTAGVAGVLAPFVLIAFGEMLPKAAALSHNVSVAPFVAPLIRGLTLGVTPLRVVLDRAVVLPLTRLVVPESLTQSVKDPQVTTDELRSLVEMSAKQGVINPRENEILQQIVALPETRVRSIMVPRVDIAAVSIDDHRETVCRRIRESGKKKLPVFGRNLDDIRGVIHAVELHLNPNRALQDLLKPVHYVPEQADLLQLLYDFRHSGVQLAIVVDEHGGTAGLVSLEDVMERIVGDIADADEPPGEPIVQRIDQRTYRLSGTLSIRSLADYFGLRPARSNVETLGGFMLEQIGRLPRPGDVVRTANLKLTVESVAARRVEFVRVELENGAVAADERGKVT